MSDLTTLSNDMARAAADLLSSLTPEQRSKINLPFEDEATRRLWYYTPTPRPGLYMGEMDPKQQQNVFRLIASGLSNPGYNYATVVMGLEWIVDQWSGFPSRTYGDVPGTRVRDPGNYCVAVFGEPGDDGGWSWRIGGHHLNLHYTLKGGHVSPTPAFFGAEPAHVDMPGGLLLRPLAAQEDIARELLASLNPDQRAEAVISPIAATDVVQMMRPRIEDGALYQIGGNGPGGQVLRDKLGLTPEHDELLRYSLKPKGLPATKMTPEQRGIFSRLVGVYFEHMAEPVRQQFTHLSDPAQLSQGTAFAWAGTSEVGAPHYYRVQGERLLIEYDCTQDNANHTHSVWRDPEGDFGEDILSSHYAAAHA